MASRSKIERRLVALEGRGISGQPATTGSQADLKRHLAALDRRMGSPRALVVAEARAEQLATSDVAYCLKMMARLDRKQAGREKLEGRLNQHLAHLDRLIAPAHYLPFVERLCQLHGLDPCQAERFIGLATKQTSGPLADVIGDEVETAASARPSASAESWS